LSEFIPNETLQILYQTREWKFQTTINELIHTQRTHLKSLKIMQKCFREPMENFPGMSPVELDCIFRNLDHLIHLHSKNKIKKFITTASRGGIAEYKSEESNSLSGSVQREGAVPPEIRVRRVRVQI
jgi:hypothetical protein